ncbi:MAG TPA: FtsQ-type POTRA domain-containing protein [Cycloclasticus sp.]|jgi:cell division protein FtsQ|nr:FtsQ-type POTRA domain-containing protein [Cycloclasticus sp.]HIL92967.1 FtsQ-type POTRA domain-containing protein [Cycloclasticus sp.]
MKVEHATLIEQIKPMLKISALTLMVALCVWALMDWMEQPETMPIKQVRIEADFSHLTRHEISQTLMPYVEAGYFAIDSNAIVQAVMQLAWVKQTQVRRVWPDTIVVTIKEQTPVAVWNKTSLLNDKGDVFSPVIPQSLMQLPHLSGLDSKSRAVLAQSQRIDQSIATLMLSVQQLGLSEHGSWQVVLNNGVRVKAGNKAPEKAMSKSLNTLASIQGGLMDHVNVIDLRYPNGLAVTWKKGYQFGQSNKKGKALALNKNQPTKG